jgi:hypothetical protein
VGRGNPNQIGGENVPVVASGLGCFHDATPRTAAIKWRMFCVLVRPFSH